MLPVWYEWWESVHDGCALGSQLSHNHLDAQRSSVQENV